MAMSPLRSFNFPIISKSVQKPKQREVWSGSIASLWLRAGQFRFTSNFGHVAAQQELTLCTSNRRRSTPAVTLIRQAGAARNFVPLFVR
jgi:hypothetical protein